jgi:hypothetical protein
MKTGINSTKLKPTPIPSDDLAIKMNLVYICSIIYFLMRFDTIFVSPFSPSPCGENRNKTTRCSRSLTRKTPFMMRVMHHR